MSKATTQTTTQANKPAKMAIGEATAIFQDIAQNQSIADMAIEHLASLCKVGAIDWAHHKSLKAAYCTTRREVTSCTVEAANKSWERLCTKVGYKAPKSTNEAAMKKAKQRAAKKAQAPATSQDKATQGQNVQAATTSQDIAAPLSGKATVGKVNKELDSIEAHIISLWRAKKFGVLIELVQREVSKTQ